MKSPLTSYIFFIGLRTAGCGTDINTPISYFSCLNTVYLPIHSIVFFPKLLNIVNIASGCILCS